MQRCAWGYQRLYFPLYRDKLFATQKNEAKSQNTKVEPVEAKK